MSSILNALKKLDENTDSPPTSTAGGIHPRQSLHRLFRPRRRLWPWGLALMMALCATAVFYFMAPWKGAGIRRPSSVQASLTAAKQAPIKQIVPPSPASKEVTGPRPAPAVRKATPPPALFPPRQVTGPEPGRKPSVAVPSASLRAKVPPPPARPKKSQPPALPESPPAPASLKPLPADAGLTLQALAWAPEPERRFTVINNQIVREGGSIGGMTVVRIEEAQVVLRKDGILWTLSYDHQ